MAEEAFADANTKLGDVDPLARADHVFRLACQSQERSFCFSDPHITQEEASMIIDIRERVQDLWKVQPDADTFIKRHERFLQEWHADLDAVKNLEKIKTVMDRHIGEDFRLIRFVRARKHNLRQAEAMLRDALMWRVALGSDIIHGDPEFSGPPEWLARYVGIKNIMSMLRPVEDCDTRLRELYTRDIEGHLGLFIRAGRLSSRKIFRKVCSKSCYITKLVIWMLELLRYDLEQHREQNPDKPQTVISLIIDLDGFAMSDQLALTDFIPIASRFAPIFANTYPELLNRVLVFNAPWLFSYIWSALRHFIPEEVHEKIQIYAGKIEYNAHIRPYFADNQVPKYFGGTKLDQTGSDFCLESVAPYGPYGLPGEGQELLEGYDGNAKMW